METPLIPRVVVLEDDPDFGDGLSDLLEAHGFQVSWFRSTLEATRHLLDQLASSNPLPPALVVIDQHLVTPGQPAAEGWVLAFVLRIGAQMGELQPCWIAAMSNAINERGRADRAREAQCDFIVSKSNLLKEVATWSEAARRPAPDHTLSVELIDLHASAVAMVRWLAQQPHRSTALWTADDVYNMVGYQSGALYLGAERRAAATDFIARLGGEAQALQHLWEGFVVLSARQQSVIRKLLGGETQRSIYEDLHSGYTRRTLEREIATICTLLANHHNTTLRRSGS